MIIMKKESYLINNQVYDRIETINNRTQISLEKKTSNKLSLFTFKQYQNIKNHLFFSSYIKQISIIQKKLIYLKKKNTYICKIIYHYPIPKKESTYQLTTLLIRTKGILRSWIKSNCAL